ncbi:MAG: deoxynucleoside kinase [Chloroflexi bacterium]|nr:deoxynucleoside kinase [Chloroflexota bacterium]
MRRGEYGKAFDIGGWKYWRRENIVDGTHRHAAGMEVWLLAERDHLSYNRLFDIVVDSLPRPDLLIYLKAPVPVLINRIHRRARNIETGISAEYLSLLDSFYDEWLAAFDLCPVLTIHSDDLDYVHQPQHLEMVAQRIQDKLAGKEEVDLRNS